MISSELCADYFLPSKLTFSPSKAFRSD